MAEEKEKNKYKLEEVATETAQVIRTPKGETISQAEALVEVLNVLKELRDGLL